MIANEYLGKCVKVCLTNIWVTESQSIMEEQDLVRCVLCLS